MMAKWDANTAVDLIDRERVTTFLGVPTMVHELTQAVAQAGKVLDSVVDINAGGSKQPSDRVARVKAAFPSASTSSGYAMTETNALGAVGFGPDYAAHPDSTGRPVPPVLDLEIRDQEGRALPAGEVGEVCMKSPANFRCYLNMQEETETTLVDGWVKSGDLGYLDEEGFLFIVDRLKDLIIRGGENISTLEVEAAIYANADVTEVAVFAIPDERMGEVVGAAVWIKPDATTEASALVDFAAERLAKFKVPGRVWISKDPLPRTATQKIDKPATMRRVSQTLPDYARE